MSTTSFRDVWNSTNWPNRTAAQERKGNDKKKQKNNPCKLQLLTSDMNLQKNPNMPPRAFLRKPLRGNKSWMLIYIFWPACSCEITLHMLHHYTIPLLIIRFLVISFTPHYSGNAESSIWVKFSLILFPAKKIRAYVFEILHISLLCNNNSIRHL